MSRQSQPVSTDFLFNAEKVPTFLRDGRATGSFAIVRTDTGNVIGQSVSKSYGVVQNADAVNVVEDAFHAHGLGNFTRKANVLRGGGELAMTYDFPTRTIAVPKVNDILGLRLTLVNSFDGSSPLAFQLGYLRLVCLNGMKSMVRELALTKKHYGTIDLAFVRARLAEAVMKAENAVQLYAAMADIGLGQHEGEHLILHLAAQKIISNSIAEGVLNVWRNPTYRQDSDRNLYNLYNAFTQHVTRNVEQERFEMARRITSTVTATFARVTRDRNELAPYLLPLPKAD